MNPSERMSLVAMLDSIMTRASSRGYQVGDRYWYPLSLPTYGVDEVVDAIDAMASFQTSMWERTRQFEADFAAYNKAKSSVMVNSGSSADLLLSFLMTNPLKPLLQRGDEILVPVVTWPTHPWSAMMAGLKVRFVDVCPATLNVDLDALEAAIGPETKALFLVHLMGNPCDMSAIERLAKKHDLLLLEDCCEALGASFNGRRVGTFGIGGSYSFFFSHHIVTMEGGAVVVNDDELSDHLRVLRAHGWTRNVTSGRFNVADADVDPRYAFVNWGFNLRPTELQAAFGIRQLARLPAFNARRCAIAERFYSFLKEQTWLSGPTIPDGGESAWFALPIMVDAAAPFDRAAFVKYLEARGVETRPVVAGNLARHPVAKRFPGVFEGHFPGADAVHDRGLYIGLSPMTDDDTVTRLIEVISEYIRKWT